MERLFSNFSILPNSISKCRSKISIWNWCNRKIPSLQFFQQIHLYYSFFLNLKCINTPCIIVSFFYNIFLSFFFLIILKSVVQAALNSEFRSSLTDSNDDDNSSGIVQRRHSVAVMKTSGNNKIIKADQGTDCLISFKYYVCSCCHSVCMIQYWLPDPYSLVEVQKAAFV